MKVPDVFAIVIDVFHISSCALASFRIRAITMPVHIMTDEQPKAVITSSPTVKKKLIIV